jgi:eukaryotic-like serine/threonine-protein kinase
MTDAWKQQEGQTVDGRFRLIQYLGGTDSSAVFLTESGNNRERVAIKLIGADPADADSQLSRLRRAAKFLHPHLARIFEAGRAQVGNASVLYIVTEYAEEDLAQILPDRALTPQEVRDMLPFIIDALQFLHSHGFVHARLKPSNVLAVNDQLKLSLDGVCATGERGAPGEKTSAYDPPELAPTGPSPAGDVWSLGMTIVEVLTKRLPVWEWTGHADPPAPRTLPAPFLEIVRNCLRRDPAMRCALREISENLDPPAPSRVAPSRTTAVSAPIASPVISSSSESKAFSKPDSKIGSRPQLEWAPPPKPGPHKSNSRYIVQGLAFVVALAAVIVVPRFFRHAHQPLDSDPIEAAAPAAEKSKPTPEPERSKPAAEVAAAPMTVAKKVSPVLTPAPPAAPVVSPIAAPVSAPPKSVTPANSSARAVRGQVVHQVLPDISQKARDTIHGKVRVSVKVSVDPSGKVTNAALDSPSPSKYFADAALRAAKNWTFAPAKANGESIKSEWLLRFEFAPTDTSTFPAEINP